METQAYIEEMTNRYVYAVIRRLPAAQKADIEKELRGLIEDMLAARSSEPAKEDIDAVLSELGKPAALAAKYGDAKNWLIGPGYYDVYLMLLKIMLAVVAFGVTVAQAVGFFVDPPAGVFPALGRYFSSVFPALFGAFSGLTIVMAVAERINLPPVAGQGLGKGPWRPADLPPVPAGAAVIKRGEPIASLVFAVLALVVFNFAPWLLGAYALDGSGNIIPIFDPGVYQGVLPLINIAIGVGMIKEIIRLLAGRYTLPLAFGIAAVNAVTLILVLFVFTTPELWSREFFDMLRAVRVDLPAGLDLPGLLAIIGKVVMVFFVIGIVADTATAFYKAIRYGGRGTLDDIAAEVKRAAQEQKPSGEKR